MQIALIHPYWDFWESSVSWDLRSDREALLADAGAVLKEAGAATQARIIATKADADAYVQDLPHVDAAVVVASMAVPPTTTMAVLDQLPEVPVVVWAVSRTSSMPPDFSHSDITTAGATVGGPMISGALARTARPFQIVASTLEDPGHIVQAVRRACAAGKVRGASLLQIGEPLTGYTSVVPPPGTLEALGPRLVAIPVDSFVRRVNDVASDQIHRRVSEIESEFTVAEPVNVEALRRAAATEIALDQVLAEERASGGAFNCHAPGLRPDARFGIAPCLALGRLTSKGFPFTCTGDQLTAVAMLVVQELGHPTLYHEVEALDCVTNEAILANTGEFDRRLCGDTTPELVPNVWFPDDATNAPCARFSVAAGPASLVSFVYAPGPRFVVAEGYFTGRRSPNTGTPNAGFRFCTGEVSKAWSRWAAAGVLHHSVATNAHIGEDIAAVAHHLGADIVFV